VILRMLRVCFLAKGGGRSNAIVSSRSNSRKLALRRRRCGGSATRSSRSSAVVSGAYRVYSCSPTAAGGLINISGRTTRRLFSASKDTETTAKASTVGADRDAVDASITELPKSRSGINLPPPPPPLSDTTSDSVKVKGRFNLPPPPPLNIAGIDRIGNDSTTKNLQSAAHVKSVIDTNVEGASSGMTGPKKISIDDIFSGGSSTTASSTSASPSAASRVEEEASPKISRDAISTVSLKEPLGPSMPALPFDGNKSVEAEQIGVAKSDVAFSNSEKDGDEDEDVTDNIDDEHVEAHVTFHPFTTNLTPSQQRELEDSRSEDDVETNFLPTSGEGGSTMLPQADLSEILPENHGTSVEFRPESILSSMDDLFATIDENKDGREKAKMNMNVKKRIKGHVPGAYRVQVKKSSAEQKETKDNDSRRDKTAYSSLSTHPSEIRSIKDGPGIRYGTDKIASLAQGSVMAASGATVVMSTVVHESSTEASAPSFAEIEARGIANAVKAQCRKHTGMLPLTVTYTERHAGVGKIPTNQARRDNMRPSESETLAARAIDRALRPLLPRECYSVDDAIEINCSVQACGRLDDGAVDGRGGGDPLAVAINSASLAMQKSGLPFTQPVGAVRLCLDYDGAVIFDPSSQQIDNSQLDLLVAATRDDIVMIEFGGKPPRAYRDEGDDEKRKGKQQGNTLRAAIYADRDPGIPEDVVADLLRISHASIQKLICDQMADNVPVATCSGPTPSDYDLMTELGLNIPAAISSPDELRADREFQELTAHAIIEDAFHFVSDKLRDSALRLFGKSFNSGGKQESINSATGALIHCGPSLLPKSVRGRREHLVRREILRLLVHEFVPETDGLRSSYQDAVLSDESVLDVLASSVHERLLKRAMHDSAVEFGTRGDGRAGSNHQGLITVRPIESTVPLLPDVVHGSSLFSRGETQVMCTTTLGAPREGQPVTNPYASTRSFEASKDCENDPYGDLPVGSLRFLKNQQALESDLNSKRVRADREMTGDSGILKEVRSAFLHYDFPSYSTGEVRKGGPAVNRRAVGHGNLAERGLLPILPPPAVFPYSIRMTSEVTSSNGSSSMASVCGSTLSLLDSGVPILAPAAGISVGLVLGERDEKESFGLLLDITGTEDHYGEMDFKVCGTESGLTAMQLDVKRPLPLDIIIEAMQVAKEGRRAILSSMEQSAMESSGGVIQHLKPRRKPKHTAPRVEVVRFDPVRKRDLIGPGGAVLKQLEDRYGVSLDLSQEGQCLLYGADASVVSKAKIAVMDLVADVEEGEVYEGTVIDIKDFGAVVELLRNKEALLHISELGDREGAEMSKRQDPGGLEITKRQLEIGQKIKVLCIGVDPVQGDIKVSRKKLLRKELAA